MQYTGRPVAPVSKAMDLWALILAGVPHPRNARVGEEYPKFQNEFVDMQVADETESASRSPL